MKWGETARPERQNPIIPTAQPSVTVVPVIVPDEIVESPVTQEDEPKEDVVTEEQVPVAVSNNTVDQNLPTKISDTMNHYSNSNFRYEFDIPANVYYA